MRRDEIVEAIRPGGFRPFRLFVSDGGTFDIRHPEMLMVTRHSAIVGIVEKSDSGGSAQAYPDIERTARIDLVHITRLEELQGRPV